MLEFDTHKKLSREAIRPTRICHTNGKEARNQ